MKAVIVIFSFCLLLTACGTPQKTLIVNTKPQGAMLIEQGTGIKHITPATVHYNINPAYVGADGCLRVRPFSAVWASGVTLNPPPKPLLLCGQRNKWIMTIHRPNAPGIKQDLAAADARMRKLEINRLEREIRQLDTVQRMIGLSYGGYDYSRAYTPSQPYSRSSDNSDGYKAIAPKTATSDSNYRGYYTKGLDSSDFYAPQIGPQRMITRPLSDPNYHSPQIGPQRPITRSLNDPGFYAPGTTP